MKKIFFSLVLSVIIGVFGVGFCDNIGVHEHGYWYGEGVIKEHQFDRPLALALARFFKKEKAKTVVDFGCGTGAYTKMLLDRNIYCEGYDGNPDSFNISGGIVTELVDLSSSFDLEKRFDWVLSLEVGEHIPKEYEKVFIENLHRHNVNGVVLSWALKGQGGFGHFNEQNNDYIKQLMSEYGYVNDVSAENVLRSQATLWWFKNTVMVFRKK